MPKIALAVITRDTKEDSKLLERLLENVSPFVSGIFITAASKKFPGYAKKITEKFKGHYSEFNWINDFSAARNFNFSQVPEEYEYIMWSDIDDVWKGLEKLKIGDKDAYAFWYIYQIDANNQPAVTHKKTMIVRNDGSFKWVGKIHEDLLANRDIEMGFFEDIHRIHLTNEDRLEEARHRNLEISKEALGNDKDPRNLLNYGNSLLGVGKYDEAIHVFERFIDESGSSDEKYLARQRLADIFFHKGLFEKAFEQMHICIGLEPTWPDAYYQIAQYYYDRNQIEDAERYILLGLPLKPPYRSMIVFNPRDYDYNPLNLLAKTYFRKDRPDLALIAIEKCLQIIPDNKDMKVLAEKLREESDNLKKIVSLAKELNSIEDKEELKKRFAKLSAKERSHPGICMVWNKNFVKTETSGKDLVYYCGFTTHTWNPKLFKTKGFGGSEEAVIHLSQEFAKDGYNVTVYANIGNEEIVENGVVWKPFWAFNPRDKVDHLILWRSPKMCDYELNANNIYIDLHDVIKEGEFTKKRLEKINKIFVKTQFHRSLFQNVPDEKFAIIPNGIKTQDFDGAIEKDQYMMLNTSSPDRSMEAVVEIYRQVKELVPNAKMYWAYGWDVYDAAHSGDKKMMKWKEELVNKMKDAGIIQLGKVQQNELVNYYKKANVFLYPSEFAEIDCISVKKAQLAGCKVITTDFGALNESVQTGIKIHSKKDKDNWCLPYQISFAVEDPLMIQEFVKQVSDSLKELPDMNDAVEFGKTFDWSFISKKWINFLK